MFIAFDGIDGAGKTTICRQLYEKLKEKYYVKLYDMGSLGFLDEIIDGLKKGKYTCSSEIRECLYYFEGHLFSDMIASKYLGDISNHILIDRYILSYLSYGSLNGLSNEKILDINKGLVYPDYYFYIDTLPETALTRIEKHRTIDKPEIGYKNTLSRDESVNKEKFIKHQTLVRNNFLNAISLLECEVHVIDNNYTDSIAFKKIIDVLNNRTSI